MADDDFVWAVKGEGHLAANTAGGTARAEAARLRSANPFRTSLARLLGVHTDERAFRLGAVGEETVGTRLDKLDRSKWLALHDIVLNEKGTNLDHLVVGPAGVFSLNTKHHPKGKVVVTKRTFLLNGYRQNYLPVAVHEAKRVGRILSRVAGYDVDVTAVIVVMGAELEIRAAPDDVWIVRRRDIPKAFRGLTAVLPDERVRDLQRVAGRPSTWSAAPA